MGDEPQIRCDPLSGRYAIIAPERGRRPHAQAGVCGRETVIDPPDDCPFCPGHEGDTPPALLTYPAADGPSWRLRVVPNKYPALRRSLPPSPVADDPIFLTHKGLGQAEVVIESPEHLADPAAMEPTQLALVFQAYADRLRAFAADEQLAYAAVFKNVGTAAGASLSHTHSQIIALPFVPPLVTAEWERCRQFHRHQGQCRTCVLIAEELRRRSRIVAVTGHFVVAAAFAPRFPYELWLAPRGHQSHFPQSDRRSIEELAALWRQTLQAVDRVCRRPAYNWVLQTAPLRTGELPELHWRLELLPRTAQPAGLEWGYGCYITPVPPETAAAQLRAAMRQ